MLPVWYFSNGSFPRFHFKLSRAGHVRVDPRDFFVLC